jgi:hypothetical protein
MSRPIHRIVIELHDNGGIVCNHPPDLILTFGLIEAAKSNIMAGIIQDNIKAQSAIQIAPANAIPKIGG